MGAQKEGASHSAFVAILQGWTANDKGKGRKSTCLCGEEHRFKECPYLIESCQPNDWTPDPTIQAKIEKKLKQSEKLRETIQRIRKELVDNKKKEAGNQAPNQKVAPSSFTATAYAIGMETGYQLRNSFILDSESNLHVCNNRE